MKILKVHSTRQDLLLTVQAENEAESALLVLAQGAYGSIIMADTDTSQADASPAESLITLKLRT